MELPLDAAERLDDLDRQVWDATTHPWSRDHLRVSREDFKFLADTIAHIGVTRIPILDPIFSRAAYSETYVNLSIVDLKSMIHLSREVVGVVSIDEAVQRG
jgi:hypothetical protein